MNPPVINRLSPEPLLVLARDAYRPRAENFMDVSDVCKLAIFCGVNQSTARHWVKTGLSEIQADRAAIACGRHPGELWSEWFSGATR